MIVYFSRMIIYFRPGSYTVVKQRLTHFNSAQRSLSKIVYFIGSYTLPLNQSISPYPYQSFKGRGVRTQHNSSQWWTYSKMCLRGLNLHSRICAPPQNYGNACFFLSLVLLHNIFWYYITFCWIHNSFLIQEKRSRTS